MVQSQQIVGEGKVVAIYFTLKDEHGAVLDTNKRGGKPMSFLVGAGNVLPALERALAGKKKDDFVAVDLAPADAYGERREDAVKKLSREQLPAGTDVKVGMRFTGRDPEGRRRSILVTAVDGDEVTIDENHPLAGKPLRFEISVCGVRAATDEEKAHGHPHGPGGQRH
jgi:FKBP-type peptidyl-prolyl cis-trans isomerase SlyD